jgi:4-amino-4-deoxy-L-arabinose transferase-like glycosyltransferase
MTEPGVGQPGPRLRWPSAFTCATALTVGWALLANFGRLGFPVQGSDEPYYAQAAWRYVHGLTSVPPTGTSSNFDNFEHPPLAKYLFGLAQLVAGHPSIVADRVVAVLCTLGTAAVLGVWLGSVAGRWVGLGAAGLVALLPMSVPNLAFRFGRYGYLDPVAELFAVTSVVLAWLWFRRSGRPAWGYAVATGACVGLAAASKENGFLGVVGPVLVGIALSGRDLHAVGRRLLQASASVVTSGLVFAMTYAGFAHPDAAFRFMLRYQQEHAKLGHRVEFAGRVVDHPPGWAFLWFAGHGLGVVVSLFCLVAVVAAILLRRDRIVLWCVAALAGPLIFHIVIARVVLSFYWVMWMPAFLALVALGVDTLARLALDRAHRGRGKGLAAGVAATSCVAVLAAASLVDTHEMLTEASAEDLTTAYSTAVLTHAPLVYLRLGEPSGNNAIDSSGRHHDGAYVKGPVCSLPASSPGTPRAPSD